MAGKAEPAVICSETQMIAAGITQVMTGDAVDPPAEETDSRLLRLLPRSELPGFIRWRIGPRNRMGTPEKTDRCKAGGGFWGEHAIMADKTFAIPRLAFHLLSMVLYHPGMKPIGCRQKQQ